jgi:hypothetical protein
VVGQKQMEVLTQVGEKVKRKRINQLVYSSLFKSKTIESSKNREFLLVGLPDRPREKSKFR